ncbi:hypothetical protein MSUIS_01630 [Mycoplasma suis KI3806]|uniref:Uncharacterized protein n=1 Tax=Mycoplasma suis (strain KI_3806) TaxID=708248 RepID=F0V334_MYCS3|nr:hypothetical protein [Mycoplasma suis]CBZ40256.1 hypothetical protein MSUIS_01630 [Mycoplasma suis KI3806]
MPLALKGLLIPVALVFTGTAAGGGLYLTNSFKNVSSEEIKPSEERGTNIDGGLGSQEDSHKGKGEHNDSDSSSPESSTLSSLTDSRGEEESQQSTDQVSSSPSVTENTSSSSPQLLISPIENSKAFVEYIYRDEKHNKKLTCENWLSIDGRNVEILTEEECKKLLIKEIWEGQQDKEEQDVLWFKTDKDNFWNVFEEVFIPFSSVKEINKENELEWTFRDNWECSMKKENIGNLVSAGCFRNEFRNFLRNSEVSSSKS